MAPDDVLRVSVDFNTMTMDPERRVNIPTHVHPDLLDVLYEGMPIVVYDEEIEFHGTVEHLGGQEWWVRLDPDTYREL